MTDVIEVAITAAYLTKGYLDERKRTGEMNSLVGEGEVEDVAELAGLATVQEQWFVDRERADEGCPGVYHYEFTEPLGAWLFHTDCSPTHEAFIAELDRRWAEWAGA